MESPLSFSSQWVSVSIATLIFLVLTWNKIKSKNSTPKLPPGPLRLPIIGNMHHLIGGLPHQKMRELALKHGPIMRLQIGQLTNIIISSREAAEQVLKTHDLKFVHRPQLSAIQNITYNYKDMGFSPYGDYYRQIRKITTMELFNAMRVKSFRSIREEETSKLVELIGSSKSGINFSETVASLTYKITSRVVCGRVWKGEDEFVKCIEEVLRLVGEGFSIADAYPSIEWLKFFSTTKIALDKLHQKLDPITQTILDEHRLARKRPRISSKQQDLVDVLLNLQEDGEFGNPISDDTIKVLIMDTFIGGVDTSATTMEWMMSELMKNPGVMEKVQAEVRLKCNAKGRVDEEDLEEMEYLKLVLKETFRLHPVIPLLLPRECKESCRINGFDIPLNSKIMVNTWAMGRDPKYWEHPEEFKPERFGDNPFHFKGTSFEYLPFGAGRRSCPGMLFGLASIEFPMAKLLFHFNWKLSDTIQPHNLDMTEEMGITTKRKSPLYIIPTPYLPLN